MSILGIDVSEHNGALDWAKIKAAGVAFAIVRSGYGTSHVDNFFAQNIRGAREQGLPVGVYHFSYALDPAGAKKEAEFVLSILKPFWREIFLPIFFDFEYDSVSYAKKQGVTLGRESFNSHAVAFCETIRAAGYTPGVYYNLDYARNYVDKSRLGGYVQWFAQYASAPSRSDWAIWQYSSSHTIPGVSGKFDANLLGDERLLGNSTKKYALGWHQDKTGWWYADTASTYYRSRWAKIKGKWYYFDEAGYMESNTWKLSGGDSYYLGADGAMMTGQLIGLGSDGRLGPVEPFCHLLSDVPSGYRKELDALISQGGLQGKSGEGESLVLDLPLSAIRGMIVAARGKK